ncbi:TauD/TfdA family dioxygenase [Lentzea rhizosphaerae]|uniref:TauD/TfdA family dioxygenase n=1 Tax=Lentzea rhizosphaerae TaxID=2041025 RepID=A0ABV8C8I1_9PSEU
MGASTPARSVRAIRRRSVEPGIDGFAHITESDRPGAPAVVEARTAGLDLSVWLRGNQETVDRHLYTAGAVVFRNFKVATAADFAAVAGDGGDEKLLDYVYGSTPRTKESKGVYTSTEYPPEETIPQHNEMAYARDWPLRLWFFCQLNAQGGGETPLADSRRVLERIPAAVRERFERDGIMYVRNYGGGVDLPWQQVFETDDRETVERFCAANEIELEWLPDGGLRTRQICQAVVEHPRTHEVAWFNQAHLFHTSSLPAAVREDLLATFSPEQLPRNALYGDGTVIEDEAFTEIRAAFEAETVATPWQTGDVMLVDNILMSHGRNPYQGPRKVLVAMSGAWSALQEAGR